MEASPSGVHQVHPSLTLRLCRGVAGEFYRGYAAIVSLTAFLIAVTILAVTPGVTRRRRVARSAARVMLALMGTRVRVVGAEHIAHGPAVVVANHASYLDGIVLQAALPPRFAFVIKQEVTGVPLVHFLLRRIGAQFVDRHSSTGRVRDARRLVRAAGNGSALVFFPEGTIAAEPGLRAFKPGAFIAASRAGVPVIPVAIRGSRRLLPPGGLRLRPGRLEVQVMAALHPDGPDAPDPQQLMARARHAILERLAEPDLAAAGER